MKVPIHARAVGKRRASSALYSVTLTNLTGGEAREGDIIGLTIDPAITTETVTYDWQANGTSTGETTSSETVDIGGVHTDGQTLSCAVTIDGEVFVSDTAPMRYAPGSVTESALADWTIDSALNINLASDFTTTNLTGTYVIAGLPTGAVDDGDGTISGAVDGTTEVPATENFTATFTDQYGRTIVGSYTVDTVYRTQATAADGLGPFTWTIDDTSTTVNASSDFTANGNTLTYTATGLPTGVTIASNSTISVDPTGTPSSGSIVITAEDEYGRETTSTTSHTTAYRTQATGGADLDLSFVEGTPTVNEDLTANWTTNGNTLTYALVTPPSLPTNLSVSSAGLLTRSGSVSVTADDTYTLRGTDEYLRTTDDTFTLEITVAGDVTAPTASSISAGTQQADGDVPITVTSLDEDSTAKWVLTSSDQSGAANTAVETAADGGTALTDQVDFGTFAATTSGGPYEEAITSGLDGTYYLQLVFVDAADNVSTVYADGPITIDTTAPTISSSSPADNATGVAITANPTVTFDETVQFGTGNITLYDVTNTANEEVFDVAVDTGGGAGTVSISGAVLTIEPTADLSNSVEYAIKIDATAIDDTTGNSFAGVTDNTTLSFTTASAGYSPTTVTFDDSTYATSMNGGSNLTVGKDIIIAMRVTLPGTMSGLNQFLGPLDTSLYWSGDEITFVAENTSGNSSSISDTPYPVSNTYSIFAKAALRATSGVSDMELYIDGTKVAFRNDTGGTGFSVQSDIRNAKLIQHVNSGNGTAAYDGFDLIGGLWIGNSGYDSLSYSDFFDGSNNPIFDSATINSQTAVFFQNGSAADWNAGTNDGSDGGFTLTGTVT